MNMQTKAKFLFCLLISVLVSGCAPKETQFIVYQYDKRLSVFDNFGEARVEAEKWDHSSIRTQDGKWLWNNYSESNNAISKYSDYKHGDSPKKDEPRQQKDVGSKESNSQIDSYAPTVLPSSVVPQGVGGINIGGGLTILP
jgi:hypothetical protein